MLTTSYPLWPGHYRGHFIRAVASEMVNCGHAVNIVTPGCSGTPVVEHDNGIIIKRFFYFPFKRHQCLTTGEGIMPNLKKSGLAWFQIPFFFSAVINTAQNISRGSDLIHAHWSINGIPGLWCRSKYGIPLVTSVRGSDYSLDEDHNPLNRVTEAILKRVDGIITENNRLMQKLCDSGIEKERVTAIHNGVDLIRFKPKGNNNSIREGMGLNARKVVLFAGRLTRVKGPDLALFAFRRLLKRQPESALLVVGDGDMRQQLQNVCDTDTALKDRVVFAGEIKTSDMPGYYNASDILLITSRAEGTPNVLLEAIASGLPVVSLPVGGIPEIIQDGVTGILTKGNSSHDLAAALVSILKNDRFREEMSRKARQWAEKNLCWSHTANRYLHFYNQVISRFGISR